MLCKGLKESPALPFSLAFPETHVWVNSTGSSRFIRWRRKMKTVCYEELPPPSTTYQTLSLRPKKQTWCDTLNRPQVLGEVISKYSTLIFNLHKMDTAGESTATKLGWCSSPKRHAGRALASLALSPCWQGLLRRGQDWGRQASAAVSWSSSRSCSNCSPTTQGYSHLGRVQTMCWWTSICQGRELCHTLTDHSFIPPLPRYYAFTVQSRQRRLGA